MNVLRSHKNHPGWVHFGKRYLKSSEFIDLCKSVGLQIWIDEELELMERDRNFYPAARIILPKEYVVLISNYFIGSEKELEVPNELAPIHELDWSLRYNAPYKQSKIYRRRNYIHPIDRSIGTLEHIRKPIQEEFVPWKKFSVRIQQKGLSSSNPTAINYYHYWQIYELYEVRKKKLNFYKDNFLLSSLGGPDFENTDSTIYFLDAISYFHQLFSEFKNEFFKPLQANDDGRIILKEKQQKELQETGRRFALMTIKKYGLKDPSITTGCKKLMTLHTEYEMAERISLSAPIKLDIWRAVELFHYASNKTTEEISAILGPINGFIGNYLELLFPNRRDQVRKESHNIIKSLIQDHNKHTERYSISEHDISALFQFIESTDLAWFQYIINEINEDYFHQNSWSTASSLLNLQSLASFPESMMKIIIFRYGDKKTQTDLEKHNHGLSNIIDLIFREINPSILKHYKNSNHSRAKDISEFRRNLLYLTSILVSASNDEMFVGVNLAIANLIRNYASHSVIENSEILAGHYIKTVKAIITTIFSSFKVSQKKGWIQ